MTASVEPTGAELLREAAAKMRMLAEAATGVASGWAEFVAGDARAWTYGGGAAPPAAIRMHMESWHPAVALAVADWLEEQADAWDLSFGSSQLPSRGVDLPPAVHYGNPEAARRGADYHARRALAVARAYLGRSS